MKNNLISITIISILIFGGFKLAEYLVPINDADISIMPTQIEIVNPEIEITETPIIIPQNYTFVLLGNDYRIDSDDRFENVQQSDAFIIAYVELTTPPRLVLVSLARELYVPEQDIRISQLYARGGFENVSDYVEDTFGLDVDGVIAVNMDGFVAFIDVIDGVEIVPVNNSYDKCGDTFYTYDANVIYRMDGFELLCYSRMRMYSANGYFDRQVRHFDVVSAILESAEITPETVALGFEYIETDIELTVAYEALWAYLGHSEDYQAYVRETYSMDQSMLELISSDPYLYSPTVDLREWMQEIIK